MVNELIWVVPLLPKDDLENILLTAIKYSHLTYSIGMFCNFCGNYINVEMYQFKDLYKNRLLVSLKNYDR